MLLKNEELLGERQLAKTILIDKLALGGRGSSGLICAGSWCASVVNEKSDLHVHV